MHINHVNFIGSYLTEGKAPKTGLPEYAFIGRSNVGKSSLINMITGRKKIAKVSSTPGKTQLINYFEIDTSWYLVDLPGYGYAKISKRKRDQWRKMIERYLEQRSTLVCTFLLIDSRLPLQKIDLEFANYLGNVGIPFVIVYTKIDKVKSNGHIENIERIENGILEHWEELPQRFMTSSEKKIGREELLDFIQTVNNNV
jgi:GTP-binding protein